MSKEITNPQSRASEKRATDVEFTIPYEQETIPGDGTVECAAVSAEGDELLQTGDAAQVSSSTSHQGVQPPASTHVPVLERDLSHDALALRMGREGFDEYARYVKTGNFWLIWNDLHWRKDDVQQIMSVAREFLRRVKDEVVRDAHQEAQGMRPEHAASHVKQAKHMVKFLKNKATISAVAKLAQSNVASVARAEEFDQDLLLLGTPGGTVDLTTGTISPAKQSDMITKQTACGPADCGEVPVLWLQFLDRIFAGDAEMIGFMKRLSGYALTGLTTEHMLFFLHGGGRNGKSVFLNVLQWIMGDYARTAASDLLMATNQNRHKTELAGLQGMRMVTANEIQKTATWNEALIKQITGGDTITANFMYGDLFDFKPQMTLFVAGNDKPRLNDVSNAMRSRMQLIPFDVQIPPEEQDRNLEDKLKKEGPQILRWAIDGALDWQKHGLCVPSPIVEASKAYLDDEDILATFLAEETKQDTEGSAMTQEIYDRYKTWCLAEGNAPMKRQPFVQDLLSKGYTETRRNTGKVILDLTLM